MSARVTLHGRDNTFTPHITDMDRKRMQPPLTPLATAGHITSGFGFGLGAFLGGASLGLLWMMA